MNHAKAKRLDSFWWLYVVFSIKQIISFKGVHTRTRREMLNDIFQSSICCLKQSAELFRSNGSINLFEFHHFKFRQLYKMKQQRVLIYFHFSLKLTEKEFLSYSLQGKWGRKCMEKPLEYLNGKLHHSFYEFNPRQKANFSNNFLFIVVAKSLPDSWTVQRFFFLCPRYVLRKKCKLYKTKL